MEGVVITLTGSDGVRRAITNSQGFYQFAAVQTDGFYTVTPQRANYSFTPAQRSFSLLADKSDAVFTAIPEAEPITNPLDTAEYFVRQQYVDVLGREPDEGGFNYWSDQILSCGADVGCVNARRRDVAAAFFIEKEFQQRGSFILNIYAGGLGRRPAFTEYSADRLQVGGANLEAKKAAFVQSFVQRTDFISRYQENTTSESFVDALIANVRQVSGIDLAGERNSYVARYNSGDSMVHSRSLVLLEVTDNSSFKLAEYNAAFVLAEYFGYLRRDPDQRGYDFWLNVLNNGEPGNYRGMVCSFITSVEYQRRFSSIVSHTNSGCR